jgi:hypothetical protein
MLFGLFLTHSRRALRALESPARLRGMRSNDLTPAQHRLLAERVQPLLGYLTRLQTRMDQRAFPADDELLLLVRRAQSAVEALHVELRYRGCAGGVGRVKK